METNRTGCQPKILVVDDHEASRDHLLTALSGINAETRHAGTSLDALRTAIRWRPRLIFMDINLPDLDGLVTVRRIRELWPTSLPHAAIVLLSAENPGVRQGQLDELEIARAIIKPVSGQAIRELALELLGQRPARPGEESIGPELRKLFISELRQQIPQLEHHLLQNDREQAAFRVHQLIAAAAISGEKGLERHFIRLNRLLRQPEGVAELARAYYETFQSAQAFLQKSGITASG